MSMGMGKSEIWGGHHAHHTTHTLKPGKMPRSTQSPCLSVLCTCDFHSLTSDQRNVTEYGGAEIHGVHDLNHNKRGERALIPILLTHIPHHHPPTPIHTSHNFPPTSVCSHTAHTTHILHTVLCPPTAERHAYNTHITRIESAHVCTGRGETRIYGIHTGIQTVP